MITAAVHTYVCRLVALSVNVKMEFISEKDGAVCLGESAKNCFSHSDTPDIGKIEWLEPSH